MNIDRGFEHDHRPEPAPSVWPSEFSDYIHFLRKIRNSPRGVVLIEQLRAGMEPFFELAISPMNPKDWDMEKRRVLKPEVNHPDDSLNS